MATDEDIYARPRTVLDGNDCHFYHRMDIPGFGPTPGGMWDLRDNVDAYLGGVDVAGKRVLEIGPASGYLTFHMESRGAEVVSVELPPDQDWEVIPDASLDLEAFTLEARDGIEHVRDAWWFAHERYQSSAKMYYGDIYALPDALGHFDIAVIASLLLHIRDPLGVVTQCANLSDSLVIAEMRYPEVPEDQPYMSLYSSKEAPVPHVWWKFSPQLFVRFGEILGFQDNAVTMHEQAYVADGPARPGDMFTVVMANRGGGAAL
jgi:SAM-dependent methyltransferase